MPPASSPPSRAAWKRAPSRPSSACRPRPPRRAGDVRRAPAPFRKGAGARRVMGSRRGVTRGARPRQGPGRADDGAVREDGAMRIVVSGASGLLGSALLPALRADGHDVVTLVRRPPRGPGEVRWDPDGGMLDPAALGGVDAAV